MCMCCCYLSYWGLFCLAWGLDGVNKEALIIIFESLSYKCACVVVCSPLLNRYL